MYRGETHWTVYFHVNCCTRTREFPNSGHFFVRLTVSELQGVNFPIFRIFAYIFSLRKCPKRTFLCTTYTAYRVAQKNGASVFHCKYFENSTTEFRGSWWNSAVLYAERSNYLFVKKFRCAVAPPSEKQLLCDAQICLYNVNKRQQHFNRINKEQNYSHCGNFGKSQFMKLLI